MFSRPTTKYRSFHSLHTTKRRGSFSRPTTTSRRVRHYSEGVLLGSAVYKRKKRISAYTHQPRSVSKLFKALFVVALFMVWFGLLLYLPYFRVTTYNFSGLQIVKQEELEAYLNTSFKKTFSFLPPKDNYFLINIADLEKEIKQKYGLNSVQITKTFPNELIFTVQEKATAAIYDNGKQYFLLDKDGTIIKFIKNTPEGDFVEKSTDDLPVFSITSSTIPQSEHIPDSNTLHKEIGSFPIIYDKDATSTHEGDTHILPAAVIKSLSDWQAALEKQGIAKVKYFTIESVSAGLMIYTDKPWYLYVQPQNISTQIDALKLILRSSHPEEYVDLRYGEKIFWK
jgi:cell division septal protein FtsQ